MIISTFFTLWWLLEFLFTTFDFLYWDSISLHPENPNTPFFWMKCEIHVFDYLFGCLDKEPFLGLKICFLGSLGAQICKP